MQYVSWDLMLSKAFGFSRDLQSFTKVTPSARIMKNSSVLSRLDDATNYPIPRKVAIRVSFLMHLSHIGPQY